MKALMISLDRKVFEEGGAARARMAGYGSVFSELHVIVYAKRSAGLTNLKIAPNVWLHSTQSRTRAGYIFDAVRIGKKLQREHSFDVLSAQDGSDTGIPAVWLARRCAIPLLLQDHADVFNPCYIKESFGNRIRALISRALFPKAALVRTVAEGSEKRLVKEIPSLAGKTYRLPVYTDTGSLRVRAPSFDLRKKYPESSIILLSVCRLVPQKNLGLALETLRRVRETEPRALLVIVGEGPERMRLEHDARELGIADAIAFEPWQDDVAPFYKGADLFLMTSNYESYGRTLVEAAACGLPFISTDVGVARELAECGAGSVCDTADAAGFAAYITDWIRKGYDRKAQAQAGDAAAQALQGASHDAYLGRYKDMMQRACPKPSL